MDVIKRDKLNPTDSKVRESGDIHSHIAFVGVAPIMIPADATTCHKRLESDEEFVTFFVRIDNGVKILVQAYGPHAVPGQEGNFKIEIRHKRLRKEKGGHAFLYVKLTSSNEEPDARFQIVTGHHWEQILAEGNMARTGYEFPQKRMRGGIVVAPRTVGILKHDPDWKPEPKAKPAKRRHNNGGSKPKVTRQRKHRDRAHG